MQHLGHMRSTPEAVSHPPCSPFLHLLEHLDVIVVVRVPDGTGIFEEGADECLVGVVLQSFVGDAKVSSQEPQHFVGPVVDVGDVGLPSEIFCDRDA